jgi:hypothetical protein
VSLAEVAVVFLAAVVVVVDELAIKLDISVAAFMAADAASIALIRFLALVNLE